jgi:hypothetical protein
LLRAAIALSIARFIEHPMLSRCALFSRLLAPFSCWPSLPLCLRWGHCLVNGEILYSRWKVRPDTSKSYEALTAVVRNGNWAHELHVSDPLRARSFVLYWPQQTSPTLRRPRPSACENCSNGCDKGTASTSIAPRDRSQQTTVRTYETVSFVTPRTFLEALTKKCQALTPMRRQTAVMKRS